MMDDAATGKRLRDVREASGRSLQELAHATRINVKFLGELEEGRAFSLPKVYRRTFLRTYARELGIDPDELTPPEAPSDDAAGAGLPGAVESPRAYSGPPVEESVVSPVARSPFAEKSQVRTMAVIVVLLLTALVMSIVWLGSDDDDPRAPLEPAAGPGSTPPAAAPARPASEPPAGPGGALRALRPGTTDSLILTAVSIESVWVHIVIDNDSTIEYTLPPRYSLTLRAKDNFLLAVGNPSGLSLSLNGRSMDVLGGGNRPVKNVLLSRKSLPE